MMKRNLLWALVCVSIVTSVFLVSCSDSGESTTDNFDRTVLLQNYADNLILPAYKDLLDKVELFQDNVDALTADVTVLHLQTAQASWLAAFQSWQRVNAFNFGPAGEQGLRQTLQAELATFPANVETIESIIASGTFNVNDSRRDARGFLAIEYLLFRLDDDNDAVVESLQNINRKNLLTALVANIRLRVNDVVTTWEGSYRNDFVASNGTDVGSSTTQFFNAFIQSYELLKNFKVALPLGLGLNDTQTRPDQVEAYYSGESIALIKTHFLTLESIWYGRGIDTEDGVGFKEYLLAVQGGPELVTETEAQLQKIHAALDKIENTPSLSEQIVSENPDLTTLFTELQKNTPNFKSTMSSRLGLAITYDSGDGD